MRLETDQALKNTSPEVSLFKPDNSCIAIPTKNLLGYRGKEAFFYAAVAKLPRTYDGEPLKPLQQLEMRPRYEQLNPKLVNPDARFPESQTTIPPNFEMRPLIETNPKAFEQPEPFPSIVRRGLVHELVQKAS